MVTTVGNGVIPGKLQTEMEKEAEKGANEECAVAQEFFHKQLSLLLPGTSRGQ